MMLRQNIAPDHSPHSLLWKSGVEILTALVSLYVGVTFISLSGGASPLGNISVVPFPQLLATGLVFSLLVVITMAALGLYDPDLRARSKHLVVRVVISFVVAFIGMHLALSTFPKFVSISEQALAVGALCAFATVLTIRILYRTYISYFGVRRVLVVGAGKKAKLFERLRRKTDLRGLEIVGFVDLKGAGACVDDNKLIQLETSLSEYAKSQQVDELVLAISDRRNDPSIPTDEILICKSNGIKVIDVVTFYERQIGKVDLASISPVGVALSDTFSGPLLKSARKRLIDIIFSLTLLLLAWPIMILVAAAILIESNGRGPVFYRQERVGKNGQTFMLLKFRSMRVDAEASGAPQWAKAKDSRVIRVGAFIRKFRLDEIPQLINVLKGDMSVVGPRPERPQIVRDLSQSIRNYSLRSLVKPGITGWAQVRYPYGASVEDAEQKLQFDLYYIKHFSIFLDLMIMLQTAQVIVWGKGAR